MTTVALFHFPSSLLMEAKVSWELAGQLIDSGQTATGVRPVTRLDGGGAWKVTLEELQILNEDQRRAFRSVSAICDGGAMPIVLRMRDVPDVPYPTDGSGLVTEYDDIMHTDDVPFSTGVGYQVGTVDAALDASALLGATRLTIAITYGGDLRGGEHFSIDHPVLRHRLYRLRTAKDNGDGTWAVTIRPPLRADTAADTKINFNSPQCVMRLASGAAMDATFEQIWFSKPTVMFVEAFPPFPEPSE